MLFSTPRKDFQFDIPDEWWSFLEMDSIISEPSAYYPYSSSEKIRLIDLHDIKPFQRTGGFKKFKLVPVLLAFQSPECALPPIILAELQGSTYQFSLTNGFHRYYASVAVGYTHIPAIIRPIVEW